jgi:hypothetical protein
MMDWRWKNKIKRSQIEKKRGKLKSEKKIISPFQKKKRRRKKRLKSEKEIVLLLQRKMEVGRRKIK